MKKLHQVSKRPHTGKLSENGKDNWRKWKGKWWADTYFLGELHNYSIIIDYQPIGDYSRIKNRPNDNLS